MLDVLEQLELAVGPLAEDGGAERLHDLLHGDRCARKLVFCGTDKTPRRRRMSAYAVSRQKRKANTHHTRPNAPDCDERAGQCGQDEGMVRGRRGPTHADGLEVDIARCDLAKRGRAVRKTISKRTK